MALPIPELSTILNEYDKQVEIKQKKKAEQDFIRDKANVTKELNTMTIKKSNKGLFKTGF